MIKSDKKSGANTAITSHTQVNSKLNTFSPAERSGPKGSAVNKTKQDENNSTNKDFNVSANRRSRSQRSSPSNDSIRKRYKPDSAVKQQVNLSKTHNGFFTNKRSSVNVESSKISALKATVKHSHSKSNIH